MSTLPLQVIKELNAEIMSLTQDFLIIEASGTELQILISLKNMKAWGIMHPTFPIKIVTLYCIKMIQIKSDQKYCSYYSIQISESKQGRQ